MATEIESPFAMAFETILLLSSLNFVSAMPDVLEGLHRKLPFVAF